MATYRDLVKTHMYSFMVVSSQLNPTKVNLVVYLSLLLNSKLKGFPTNPPSTYMVVMNPWPQNKFRKKLSLIIQIPRKILQKCVGD